MNARTCRATNASGEPCRQAPLRDGRYCFWHEPENEAAAAEARRLGRARRKREATIGGAFEIEGLATVADLRRLLMVAATDALGLDNSIARVRALTSLVQVGAKLLETGELEATAPARKRRTASSSLRPFSRRTSGARPRWTRSFPGSTSRGSPLRT